MLIRLTEQDRSAFELDNRVLDFDLGRLTAREAVAIQDALGVLPAEWQNSLAETPHGRDPDGWSLIWAGRRPPMEPGSEPLPAAPVDWLAWLALAWLALRRAGRTVAWDECDVDLQGLRWRDDESAEDASGKGDRSTPESISVPESKDTPQS